MKTLVLPNRDLKKNTPDKFQLPFLGMWLCNECYSAVLPMSTPARTLAICIMQTYDQPWQQQATGRRLKKAFRLWEMFSLVREWCNSARLLTVRDSLLVAVADPLFCTRHNQPLIFHCRIYVWFFCLQQSLQDLEPDFLDPDNLKDCRFYVHTNIIQSKPCMNGHSNVHARSTLEYCETPWCARLLCWHSQAHLQQFNSKVDRIWMGARWTGKENMRKLRFYGWNMDVWISALCTFIFVSKFSLFAQANIGTMVAHDLTAENPNGLLGYVNAPLWP